MAEYKTPGVYIQEVSTLPASIAPVATAVPAFIGYTAKSIKNGAPIPINSPTRISSYLEYKEFFGESYPESYGITLSDGPEGNVAVDIADPTNFSPYRMTYQVYMYFNNGGGPCYIVSVGTHVADPDSSSIEVNELLSGMNALEEEDEPTILVVPEAVILSEVGRKSINDALLTQCAKLQDRFALMDVISQTGNSVKDDGDAFRNEVGTGNLKYGAAYYPNLKSSLFKYFDENSLEITDNRGGAGAGAFHGQSLATLANGAPFAIATIRIINNDNIDGDTFTINGVAYEEGNNFNKATGVNTTAEALLVAIEGTPNNPFTVLRNGAVLTLTATSPGSEGASIPITYTDIADGGGSVSGSGTFEWLAPDKTIYNEILTKLKAKKMLLYPSASIAGVYARVDRQRGVWKAPANVDIRGVIQPGVTISAEDQGLLNVDATSGKSINAIRFFSGKGILVWGARTLAGNDNEWRYIPVRRLYIFIEESVKKATEFVVFEPNDANTWLRVKTMIENFLSNLWREGALAGAKSEEAFFVNVGLGKTMTPVDILEGRLIVEIGMAAVRPAEFIILKFSHKLQES